MSYADLSALKSYLRVPDVSATDDEEMQRALDSASSMIDHLCSRTFDLAGEATARLFAPVYNRRVFRWTLAIDDLMSVTDLAVKTWSSTDTDWTTAVAVDIDNLRPVNVGEKPWSLIVLPTDFTGTWWPGWEPGDASDYVQVTARWGWTSVPAGVSEACLIQAARLFKRRDALFGIIAAPDGSAQTSLRERLDPDAVNALRGYVKYWAAR